MHVRTTSALIVIILFGFALRMYRLNEVPLRGDEAFTVMHWMREPLADTLTNIATVDPHPPLAYAMYRGWALTVGAYEHSARLLPALLNILGIPALFALGSRLVSPRFGLLAALFWAIHPYQIWHAQDARNYAIWAAFSAISLWLAIRALQRQTRLDWIVYIVGALISAYIYYLEAFTLVALNLYVLIAYWRNWRVWKPWAISQLIIGTGLALWYLQERLLVSSGYGGTTGNFEFSKLWTWFIPSLMLGENLPPSFPAWTWIGLLALLMWGFVLVWKNARKNAYLIALLSVVPLVSIAVVSVKLNVFTPRYILSSVPAYILLISALVFYTWESRQYQQWISIFLLAFLLILNTSVIRYGYYDYAKTPPFRTLSQYLTEYAQASDITIQAAADEAVNFYHDEYNLTIDRQQLPANPRQVHDEIAQILAQDRDTYASIWRTARTFPDWQNAGFVETWLDQNMQRVRHIDIGTIPVTQYMDWQVDAEELASISTPLDSAQFADIAELVGAEILDPKSTNQNLTVWLYWKALDQSTSPLKVSVQLLGELNTTGSPLWTQDDRFLQNGRISTTTWELDEIYRDVYTLPLNQVPAGNYTIAVALYDPQSNQRISINGEDLLLLQEIALP